MSSFTMTPAEIMWNRGIDTVDAALSESQILGLSLYPIFDEGYRDILNAKIMRRYWNRETGDPSLEMFRFRMDAKMRELMPYYNELYLSTQIEFDPISTMDIKTVADNTTSHSETATNLSATAADSGARTVNSIMPQNQLSGNGDYADNMSDVNSEGTNTTNASQDGAGEQNTLINSHVTGYQGLPADLLRRYRETIINVDMMILDSLSTLFMAVTSTGDDHFQGSRPYFPVYPFGIYYF